MSAHLLNTLITVRKKERQPLLNKKHPYNLYVMLDLNWFNCKLHVQFFSLF